jgi:hypothetical protein
VRYFANPSTERVREAMRTGLLNVIETPKQGNRPVAGVTWCADNGCFGDGYPGEDAWFAWLQANAHRANSCAFAVAPDVVSDAWATQLRSMPWLTKIREFGYPAAYVAQNGARADRLPWEHFDVLFLGGGLECVPCRYVFREPRRPARDERCPSCHRRLTEWKLGQTARSLTFEARRRGKRVHMGRVNSLRRLRYAHAIGCDSADGTFIARGPDQNLPTVLYWLREIADQRDLFPGVLA